MAGLEILKQNREALLLAEVAAWLHDMGKCADEHIVHQASDAPPGHSYRYKSAQSHRLPSPPPSVNLLGETATVQDLIERGMPRIINDNSQPWMLRALGKCHAVAHVEKELDDRDRSTKQPQNDTRLSTAFGIEGNPVSGLTQLLDKLPLHNLSNRAELVARAQDAFSKALGDTRRPVNEVTLADWSGAVAMLYKSALAGALLGVQPDPDNLRWRVLRVNFDVLGLYAKAVKIADLLGYQRAVEQACEELKRLVEEEYPLGNEIYRDTSGIYFTFPDLDLPADRAQEIRRRIETIDLELAPRIAVEQPQGDTAVKQPKRMLADARTTARQALAYPFVPENLSPCWQQQWDNLPDGKWEVCPVCRLRPKEEKAEACDTCLERRGSRIEAWEKNPAQTIWVDEIADHNDRVALVVGKFGLEDWLSGDLVQTMFVKAVENNPSACVPKNPSPARLRRVWETCARFWQATVEEEILAKHNYAEGTDDAELRCLRLLLIPDKKNEWRANVPYDGTTNGKPISLLWRDDAKHFVTIINLQLTGNIQQGQTVIVSDPDDPQRKITFTVKGVMQALNGMGKYLPYLSLLTSPDQFLALVPAYDALEIAEKIRQEYQKQFGKVQNRLPLFLGLVFFPRKMPLVAVMDAARRMLEGVNLREETWQVECNRPDNNGSEHRVRLSLKDERISLSVPTKMGDGATEDVWYPYFFVDYFADGTPDNRARRFQYNWRWLVHVKELQEGDRVRITPSRFTYLWLDSTARRFEFDPQKDVQLLDELPRLMAMWEAICQSRDMSDSKLQAIHALFEAKRQEWNLEEPTPQHPITDDVYRHLVKTTLQRDNVQATVEDVLNGQFHRCVDLYLHILKCRVSTHK